jgi:methylthioribose-1-phosphate isomerase
MARAKSGAQRSGEVRPIVWEDGLLKLLDQRRLPRQERYLTCRNVNQTARAIHDMVVRGAPAIGVAAAYGLAMEARRFRPRCVKEDFAAAAEAMAAARPTAVNLRWAVERLARLVAAERDDVSPAHVARLLAREAERMHAEDIQVNRRMGEHGSKLLARCAAVVTHCNAGALATAGYGTALGVIRAAWEAGSRFGVYATETRPYLQGARLTSWELTRLGIPVTLVTDSMVGSLFQRGGIGAVVVGTDRTAANGDVANKIGTYTIAVLARRHGVPFYVAAPTSSIDLDCASGAEIPIEQRGSHEVTHIAGKRVAAEGVEVFNPAFDVTPADLVTALVTEHGVVRGDLARGLRRVVEKARRDRRRAPARRRPR